MSRGKLYQKVDSPTIKIMLGDREPLATATFGSRTSFDAASAHAFNNWLTKLSLPVRNTQTGEFWQ